MPRESIESYYLKMLPMVSSRSTCARRQVAAIITDISGHVLSTGYNGVPSGYPHCTEAPCPGRFDPAGDTRRCMSIHAEQNALLQCSALDRAYVMYCTVAPCLVCAKLIANTRIRRVIYGAPYSDMEGVLLLSQLGREVINAREVEGGDVEKGRSAV